jgi:hypothetical protein
MNDVGQVEKPSTAHCADAKRRSLDQACITSRMLRYSNVMYIDDLAVFENAITMARSLTGGRRRAGLLTHICQFFLDAHTHDELKELLDGDTDGV